MTMIYFSNIYTNIIYQYDDITYDTLKGGLLCLVDMVEICMEQF